MNIICLRTSKFQAKSYGNNWPNIKASALNMVARALSNPLNSIHIITVLYDVSLTLSSGSLIMSMVRRFFARLLWITYYFNITFDWIWKSMWILKLRLLEYLRKFWIVNWSQNVLAYSKSESNSNILNANWDNLYNCIALTLKGMGIDTDRNFLLGGNANHPDHLLR